MTEWSKHNITQCFFCGGDITFHEDHLSKNGKPIPQTVDIAGEIVEDHHCIERGEYGNNYITKCRECGIDIVFSNSLVSKSGKKIPISKETGKAHDDCPVWIEKQKNRPRNYVPCRRCKDDIYFSNDFRTEQGKWIPVDRLTDAAHKCV
jgi:hypothetical protein